MSANGQLTPDELALIPINATINTSGAQYVTPPMLKYLLAAAQTFHSQRGKALFVAEGYRTLATQIDYFTTRYVQTPSGTVIYQGKRWSKKSQAVATAAVPGTSLHGMGTAVDLWSGIDTSFTSADHLAFVAISKIYGFRNTGTAFGEPWHFEWTQANVSAGVTDVAITHPTSSGGTITPGTPTNGTDDDDMSAQDITDIKAALGNLTNIVAQMSNAITDPNNGVQKNAATAAGKATDNYNVLQNVQNLIVDTDNRVTAIQKKVGA